ncbi:hypothetical protein HY522_02310 [bacterium]|nr:hypothetical protein [bacterium]
MSMKPMEGVSRFFSKFRPLRGYALTEDGSVGVAVKRMPGGRWVARLMGGQPQTGGGWVTPIEPIRFFARRTVVPREFAGREIDYIRYNQPELVPLPQTESLAFRFSRLEDPGEVLLYGIRRGRLEEFLEQHRERGSMPEPDGVVPPPVALAALLQTLRPGLAGKTVAILVGQKTTRYVGLKEGHVVGVYDESHRPDRKDGSARFRKTLQRVMGYMAADGLGESPDRVILLGGPSVRGLEADIQEEMKITATYLDVLSEVNLEIPDDVSAEPALLALGAAFCQVSQAAAEINFIAIPKETAARRFDAYDLLIYGSLSVCVALCFITLNAVIADRVRSLHADLQDNARKIRVLREDVESKRGLVPVSKKLLDRAVGRSPQAGRDVLETLPEFFSALAKSIPEGVTLDRVGSGDLAAKSGGGAVYRSILTKIAGARRITLLGHTSGPEKAMEWLGRLSKTFQMEAVMEEMTADPNGGYRFRIVLSPEEVPHA